MAPSGKFIPSINVEASAELQDAFSKLLDEKYDYAFAPGDILTGKVMSKESSAIFVDIGAKTLALLPVKELEDRNDVKDLEIGQSYEFYILRGEDEEGQLTLSRKRLAQAYAWKKLEQLFDADETIECEVTSTVKGGLLVDVMSLRGFVPSSHIRSRGPIEEMIGQRLPFKLLSVNQSRNNIILSNKKVMADQQHEERKEAMNKLQEGAIIEGEVVRITDFGAFVDLGGVDGLLPLSQMSWRWVEHPSDVLAIGDHVKVEVIGVDADRNRISLSMKTLQADPWQEVSDKYGYGAEVNGKITRIKPFGAFVEIHPGVEALLPSKEIQEFEHGLGQPLEPNQIIKAFIGKFTPQERRISLAYNPPHARGQQHNPEHEYADVD